MMSNGGENDNVATIFSENPFALWAKLPQGSQNRDSFHPLLCHMMDVAAVAGAMWRDVLSATSRRKTAEALGLSVAQAEGWILYLAALHDLGKASPSFQLREESTHLASLYSRLGTAPRGIKASDCPHGRVTAKELPDLLRMNKALAERLSVAIGGHHGLFPTSVDLIKHCPTDGVGRGAWKVVRKQIAECLANLLDISSDASPQQVDHAALMFIAGLVSVADWIGSNNEFFRISSATGETFLGPIRLNTWNGPKHKPFGPSIALAGRAGNNHINHFHSRSSFPFLQDRYSREPPTLPKR